MPEPVRPRDVPREPVHNPRAAAAAAGDWDALSQRMRGCVACGLSAGRVQVVPGQCPPGAELLLLGEAPGATEDAEGVPFVGRSGALLDAVLAEVGLSRERVAVANVVKCRPPDNRAPKRQEIKTCAPWLRRQIDLVDPLLVVTLGLTAAHWAMGGPVTLASTRGTVLELVVGPPVREVPLLVTYHPSAALRFGPRGKPRAALAEDLRHAADLLTVLRLEREFQLRNPPAAEEDAL